MTIATCRRARQPSRRPVAPVFDRADELHDLARQVRRLGVTGRCTPEDVFVAKDEIAHRLVAIARELGR